MKQIDWTKVLDAGYAFADKKFDACGWKREGKLEARVLDWDGVAGQTLRVERPFVAKGAATDTTLDGKFNYAIRTGGDSGGPEDTVQPGEVKWKGVVWGKGFAQKVMFGFSGLSEDDDVLVARAMEAELRRQMED